MSNRSCFILGKWTFVKASQNGMLCFEKCEQQKSTFCLVLNRKTIALRNLTAPHSLISPDATDYLDAEKISGNCQIEVVLN